MSDAELQKDARKIAKAIRELGGSNTSPIKSCVIIVPGYHQICLPNVKYAPECNQIAHLLSNSGYAGAVAIPNKSSGCNPETHTVLRTPLRPKKKSKP